MQMRPIEKKNYIAALNYIVQVQVHIKRAEL